MTYFVLAWYAGWDDLIIAGDEEETPLPFATIREAKDYASWISRNVPLLNTKIIRLPDDDPAHVTRAQASRMLGKSTRQLQRWEKDGKLHPFFFPGRGNVTYYSRQEVDALRR